MIKISKNFVTMIKYIILFFLIALKLPCSGLHCFAWDAKLGDPIEYLQKKESTSLIRYKWLEDENIEVYEIYSEGFASQENARKNLDKVISNSNYFLDVCFKNKIIRIYQTDETGNPLPGEIILRRFTRWLQ